jgi:hypothetical protein
MPTDRNATFPCTLSSPYGCIRWASRSLEWKTCSLEVGDGFSKQTRTDGVQIPTGGCSAESFRFRQWDAKTWVDDVSTELL